jgi:hypothetical protein
MRVERWPEKNPARWPSDADQDRAEPREQAAGCARLIRAEKMFSCRRAASLASRRNPLRRKRYCVLAASALFDLLADGRKKSDLLQAGLLASARDVRALARAKLAW